MNNDLVAYQETFQKSNIYNNLKELSASRYMNISMLHIFISAQTFHQNDKELNVDVSDRKACKMETVL